MVRYPRQVNCAFHWEFYQDGQKKECMNSKTYSSIETRLSHISSLKAKNLDLQRQEEMTKKPTYTFLATIQSSSLIILGSFTLNPEVPKGNWSQKLEKISSQQMYSKDGDNDESYNYTGIKNMAK